VLINGRRLETSGIQAQSDFFDLNNIPLGAVDRIEVVGDGSSAIYGSDAIAGVVNVILRKDYSGIELTAERGRADEFDETRASAAFGKTWNSASFSAIASYQTNGDLKSNDRSISASNDYTKFGGPNNNLPICYPGNVFSLDGSTLPG